MFKFNMFVLSLVATLFGALAAPTELSAEGSNGGAAPNPYQQLLLTEFRSACIKMSGSEEGYLKTVSSFRTAGLCFVESDNVAEFVQDIRQNGTTKENRMNIIERYYPALNRSLECLNDIIEGVTMCSGADFNATKQIYSKMITNLFELMTKDGGQMILDFQSQEVQTCISDIVRDAEHCKVYDNIFKKPISQFEEHECRILNQSKKCVKQLADRCKEADVMAIFNATYSPIEEAAKCNTYNESSGYEENAV